MPTSIVDHLHAQNKLFITGPFGAGKTTLGLDRVGWLLSQERIRGDDITVLVPQRTVGRPYYRNLRRPHVPPGPPVRVTTVASLAKAGVELYWPLLAEAGGFTDPGQEPTFLNLETSQYHMARFVAQAFDNAEFDSVLIDRARVVSQVLDNMNKAALFGMGIDDAYARLTLAVPPGDQRTGRLNALAAARRISEQFRQLCLDQTLVDYSLLIHLFNTHVLTNPWSRTHLFRTCRHLIVDNVEEETRTAHDLIQAWLPHLDSALILSDADAGYRLFLGADPAGVAALAAACDERLTLPTPADVPPAFHLLEQRIRRATGERPVGPAGDALLKSVVPVLPKPIQTRYYPQMIKEVVAQITRLINEEGVEPGRIAVLAPYMSDALRFSLQTGLTAQGIASRSHRPSRPLQSEPAARTLLTLAALGHPHWGIRPLQSDVTLALDLAIDALDPVRAHLLAQVVFPQRQPTIDLLPFVDLRPAVQQRITFSAGEAYTRLHGWLADYRAETEVTPLDQFFARLFGEVLSQPGFGFHRSVQAGATAHGSQDVDAARIANQLVVSARNFRWAMSAGQGDKETRRQGDKETGSGEIGANMVGREYLRLVESGALGALYLPGWDEDETAVFLAPAYTFLMRNRTVDVQFWLDVGSPGWWERLYQPLTHPYVLSHRWPKGEPWTDLHEYTTRQETLRRLMLGLIRRTRRQIILALSDYGESGFEQRGPLLSVINAVLAQEPRVQATQEE